MTDLAPKYNPNEVEKGRYQTWLDEDLFKPSGDKKAHPYSIVIPPPNVTGKLHLGHAWDTAIQDTLIRFKRMQGYDTLYLPGMDHAGIATQAKVEAKLRKQGKDRHQMGREAFVKQVWDWKDEYAAIIKGQWAKMGLSLDYSRERFTLDKGLSKAVKKVFVQLYNEGLIYRGEYIINWDPALQTALSDIEVIHKDDKGAFYHIKYPFADGSGYVEIATTRPETMFGDTAVAVAPGDKRYKDIVGKELILPLVGRHIPIIEDQHVDPEFGTGLVKITPAHDPNDFGVGQRHNLEEINVMNEDGTMNELAGKYQGMDRYECRKQLMKDLEEAGYVIAIKDHPHAVGTCYRCHTVIEPRLSEQWFVKMDELAKPAIEILKSKELEFVPERYDKTYLQWLENIRDWCISRQLWWGHQIPAYYCQECGEVIVAKEKPEACKCGCSDLKQDEDVLDTWFSSALWPFSTLGWPHNTEELEYYYPTNVLVTGYDIIFFWVVRMAFAGMFCMNEKPFDHVLIHGLVRDSQGRKMSKSLGNGIDPLEVIDQYGADALRFMLVTGNSPGNDMRFYMERVEAARNFANKLWNASRFVFMNIDEEIMNGVTRESVEANLTIADKWIISRANNVVKEVIDNMDKFDLGIAAQKIYDFAWTEYCDWYIEIVKPRLYGDDVEAKKAKVIIVPTEEKKSAVEFTKEYFVTLASASMVEIADNENNIPEDAVSVVINGAKIFIPLDELVDFEKEKERLTKEKAKLEGEIKRVNGKLSNQGFLAKAPESLVNEEKAKKEKFEEMMKSVLERLENIEAKIK